MNRKKIVLLAFLALPGAGKAANYYTCTAPNYNSSIGGAAGSGAGWYLAATPKSTTIKTSLMGAEVAKDLGALQPGKDYYVFIDDKGELSASLSSTESGKTVVGGFHTMCCSTTGLDAGHPYSGYSAGQIMPTSVWTKKHH
ncbi:MAG: hypothetical protein LBL52_03770, partial [Rickettsiales bacterium]|nr:hypothetical protein [Rickettsiales bacterium]